MRPGLIENIEKSLSQQHFSSAGYARTLAQYFMSACTNV